MKEERKKVFTNQFDVDLCEDIIKVSSITARFPKVPSSDGRNWQYKVWQPGQPTYGNITFEGVEHKDTFGNIKDWVKQVYDGGEPRKDITVNIRTQQQEGAARAFNLHSCMPTAFSSIDLASEGAAGTVVHWTLEVRVNRMTMG